VRVTIRHYQSGDEQAQVEIYNTAAAALPKFKAATLHEVQRRIRARDFDAATRFYAEESGRVVGYCVIQPNGRVSYPWCLPGHEAHAAGLVEAALNALRQRGVRRAFSAYRSDWPAINEFFRERGFQHARDMVSFVQSFLDMPTPSVPPASAVSPLTPADVPAVFALGAGVLRATTPEALHQHLFANPYFPANALYALRSRPDAPPAAVGIFITEGSYGDPRGLDANMPCFRLGAFGTEGMSTKRVKGMFSFLARPDRSLPGLGMDLLGQAAHRVGIHDDIECFAAQVSSDAPALLSFYQQHFQKQGSFPVLERDL
jgi:GNAT superfamily N-acetyltransferase